MKIFRFDSDVGQEIDQFGSVNVTISKIVHLKNDAVVHCVYIRPNGKIGSHQAVTQQLFLLVQGEGWVRGESNEKHTIQAGQAAFWEKDEWHESSTGTGMTAVIIEAVHIDPAEFMSALQKDEP